MEYVFVWTERKESRGMGGVCLYRKWRTLLNTVEVTGNEVVFLTVHLEQKERVARCCVGKWTQGGKKRKTHLQMKIHELCFPVVGKNHRLKHVNFV